MNDNVKDKDEAVEAASPETVDPARKKIKTPKKKVGGRSERIKELEAKLAEAEDKTLRLRAEYDNYRKRCYRELSDARAYAKTDALTPILNVYDHFKMAVSAAESGDDTQVIHEGLKLINSEFAKAMDELGILEIDAVGEKFDPNLHEAVAEEFSELEEGVVVKQWRCGYKMGDKLLRPASVVVSSGLKREDSE
ncbi:MAG: nucleotide exchange factor GrpE [Kiritimatiellaeota bacterium]|nr:nucleotide exchange factor GrpE [Kiritimatiellota bacterium]